MADFLIIIKTLESFFPKNFEVFQAIIEAVLKMNGKKTMLNISRWTEGKACYRTIERFYDRKIEWLKMNLMLIFTFEKAETILIANDETIKGKSGKKTKGLDIFFSSILQKPIKSVCFSGISVIIPEKRKSYPIISNQLIYTDKEKLKQEKDKKNRLLKKESKKRVGRPKGSKNKEKEIQVLAPTFRLLEEQLIELRGELDNNIKYFLGDGKYGNNTVVKLCKKYNFDLISKLQNNSSLFFEPVEEKLGKGRPRKYGNKVNFKNLPDKYLVTTKIEDKVTTKTYQMNLLSKSFEQKLNVVIIQKSVAEKVAHVIFFSTDLDLSFDKIIDFYSLRFQIEFNFRDAKEFWGLSDFMNIKEKRIHNASNLAFFMCTLSSILVDKFREKDSNSKFGIRDLLSFYKAEYYWNKSLKLLLNFNNNFIIPDSIENITSTGAIHV